MAAQSVASRSRRPNRPLDADDAFVARAVEFTEWARRNVRIIIVVAVLALIVIGGGIYYRMYQAERQARAAAEFMQLEQAVAGGNVELARQDLQLFVDRFSGTTYADEARVLLGRIHLQEGNPQAAVSVLEPAARRIGPSPIGAPAALLLASAQEQAGQPDAAVDTYLRVAQDARLDVYQQEALSSAALLREQQGNHAGAAELYRRLVDMTEPGTMERSIYEMRLAEAEGLAGAQ